MSCGWRGFTCSLQWEFWKFSTNLILVNTSQDLAKEELSIATCQAGGIMKAGNEWYRRRLSEIMSVDASTGSAARRSKSTVFQMDR